MPLPDYIIYAADARRPLLLSAIFIFAFAADAAITPISPYCHY